MTTAYVNGKFQQEAFISPFDLGLLRGWGVFETFRTYEGRLFFLQQRLDRLFFSANGVNISLDYSHKDLEEIIHYLITHNGFSESIIRILVTKGITEDGISPTKSSSLMILTTPFTASSPKIYEEGISAITTRHQRSFPHIKTLHYLPALLALEKAKKQAAQEVLYMNSKGDILEGTTCNFFAIKGNSLLTAHEDILLGITRDILLKKASSHFNIELRPINKEEIPYLDEAFLTSSIKEIVPLVSIDEKSIGKGIPGQHTKHLMQLFRGAFVKLAFN